MESVFLLTGSDNRIHLFVEDRVKASFVEVEIGKFFPEFDVEYQSIPNWVKSEYLDLGNSRRLSVVGCECGWIGVSFVECKTRPPVILQQWEGVYGDG